MDAVNRVNLALWYKRRAFLMLKCFGADRGNEWFAKAAKEYFSQARAQIGLARVAAGMVKRLQWWIIVGGDRVAVVSALSADEAWTCFDWLHSDVTGLADDVEPCTAYEGRPTTHTGLEYWCEL